MIAALLLAASAPVPLTAPQQRAVRCVAALAIVASEQQRGTGGRDWPALRIDGARFAQVTGERLMAETGRTREQMRDAILAAVAEYQKAKGDVPRGEVDGCIALMRETAPPPSLPRCAARMKSAAATVRGRDGLTAEAKDLATLASVLDYRAREALREQGLSGDAVDQTMSAASIEEAADVSARTASAAGGDPDYDSCAALAAP